MLLPTLLIKPKSRFSSHEFVVLLCDLAEDFGEHRDRFCVKGRERKLHFFVDRFFLVFKVRKGGSCWASTMLDLERGHLASAISGGGIKGEGNARCE